ncbi:MAG: tetratricopeptide repeat protein [Panacibacter sp.]
MKRLIHIAFLFGALVFTMHTAFAQTQDAETLHETARSLMRQGDFENAILVINKALVLRPDDLDLQKEQAFIQYLQRDFANSIATGKKITARPDADVQSFQILGLAYKAIADTKESYKMYNTALKKFPKSGVLYSEYGDLLAQNNTTDLAIKQWEKGIETDPNHSSNYYFASKYYAQKGNIIWGLLYGEIFVNIESLSARTTEIKTLLFTGYQKLFSIPAILNNAKQNGSAFEKAVATNLAKFTSLLNDDVSPETLTALRTRFILNWFNGNERQFPFRLFEHQRLLLQEGYFDAYNQWLTGASADTQQFQAWTQNHADDVKAFQQFQRSVIFKIPAAQYYFH